MAFAALMAVFSASCTKPEDTGDAGSTDDTGNVSPTRYITTFESGGISTKVSFGDKTGNLYDGLWTDGESAKIVMTHQAGLAAADTQVSTDDGKIANFTAEFDAVAESGDFRYFAVVPAENYISTAAETGLRYNVPEEQTSSESGFDPAASVLVGMTQTYETQQGTPAEDPSKVAGPLKLEFDYGTAYGRMTLSNMQLIEGETIVEVAITADEALLTGTADYKNGEISVVDGKSSLRIAASETEDIWFASLPAILEDGKWTVVVSTDSGTYTRRVSDAGKNLTLVKGTVAEFSVDMSEAVYDAGEVIPYTEYIMAKDCELEGDLRIDGNWVKGMNYWRPSTITVTLTDVPSAGRYRFLLFVNSWSEGYNQGFGLVVNNGEETLHWVAGASPNKNETMEIMVPLKKGANTILIKSALIENDNQGWGTEFCQFVVTNQPTPTELDGTVPGAEPEPERTQT